MAWDFEPDLESKASAYSKISMNAERAITKIKGVLQNPKQHLIEEILKEYFEDRIKISLNMLRESNQYEQANELARYYQMLKQAVKKPQLETIRLAQ